MQTHSKNDRVDAARRKNRAVTKLIRATDVDPIFKLLVVSIIDKLNCKSGYRVAWPSVPHLSKLINRSTRTTLRYLKGVYASGIFVVHRLEPTEAVDLCFTRFGIRIDLSRCRKYSPNVYEIDVCQPLWNSQKSLDDETLSELRKIASNPNVDRSGK